MNTKEIDESNHMEIESTGVSGKIFFIHRVAKMAILTENRFYIKIHRRKWELYIDKIQLGRYNNPSERYNINDPNS